MKKEIENEWEALEEIQEANSSDRIDQLNSSRFEMQSGKRNLPRGEKRENLRKMKRRVYGKKFRKKKPTANMGAQRGE